MNNIQAPAQKEKNHTGGQANVVSKTTTNTCVNIIADSSSAVNQNDFVTNIPQVQAQSSSLNHIFPLHRADLQKSGLLLRTTLI
jgi:hypothetical protein